MKNSKPAAAFSVAVYRSILEYTVKPHLYQDTVPLKEVPLLFSQNE